SVSTCRPTEGCERTGRSGAGRQTLDLRKIIAINKELRRRRTKLKERPEVRDYAKVDRGVPVDRGLGEMNHLSVAFDRTRDSDREAAVMNVAVPFTSLTRRELTRRTRAAIPYFDDTRVSTHRSSNENSRWQSSKRFKHRGLSRPLDEAIGQQ